MNFEKDLREQIIEQLKENNIIFNKKEDIKSLLINYFNFINRTIYPFPRKVVISDNIKRIIRNNKLNKKYIDAVSKFKLDFEKGLNMNGHLSANIYYSDLFSDKGSNDYRCSRDYLLDDWGIYHLHLNEKPAKNEREMRGRINGNRSEYLLFIKVEKDKIYFIDVLSHNEKNVFAKQQLLETLDRNWHFILEKYKSPDAIATNPRLTDKQIDKARKKGHLVFYQINNRVYRPIGGGLTSAGTNNMHSICTGDILYQIRSIESDIKNNYYDIKNKIRSSIKNYTGEVDFNLKLISKGYLVTEINTNFKILYIKTNNGLGVYYDGG